jgi:hypothetical protein
MSLSNINYAYPSEPVGMDKALKGLAAKVEALPWIAVCYPHAFVMKETTVDGKVRRYPAAHKGSGEFPDLSKNDTLSAYAYILQTKDAKYKDIKGDEVEMPIALIVWVNYDKVDPEAKTPFNGKLLNELEGALRYSKASLISFTTDPIQVFKEVDAYRGHTFAYPHGCLRIELLLTYQKLC